MAKTISVADDVYDWMKKRKGDRSFSELIRSLKSNHSNFSKVNGIGVTGSFDEVEESVDEASEKSFEKVRERFS